MGLINKFRLKNKTNNNKTLKTESGDVNTYRGNDGGLEEMKKMVSSVQLSPSVVSDSL